jgi:hypothetical protein
MKLKKKGVFAQLGALAVGVAALCIALVVGFLIMAQGKTQIGTIAGIDVTNATQCAANTACAATGTLQSAAATIPNWVPLVIIAVIGALLIGLVGMFRAGKQ